MIMNFLGASKTRRSLGEKKIDILGREKCNTGKVTKPVKNLEMGKIMKANSGKVGRYPGKYPGRIINCVGNPTNKSALSIELPGKINLHQSIKV